MRIRKELWFGFSLMAVIIATILLFTPWGALTNGHLGLLMLALVVVTEAGDTPDAAVLMEWTNQRVGRQQRLAGVMYVADLPRNPNGKILKRELRKQYADWEHAR